MKAETVHKLRSEKDSSKTKAVLDFLSSCEPPKLVLLDHGRAAYYYKKYTDSKDKKGLPDVSKLYFLYIWFCYRGDRASNVDMRCYRLFNENLLDVSTVSYRDFTQAYTDSVTYTYALNAHYSANLVTVIYYRFPISLKSLLDRLPLKDSRDYITLMEGTLVTIKSTPKMMTDAVDVTVGKKYEKESLLASYKHSTFKSTHKMCVIESDEDSSHSRCVRLVSLLTDAVSREEHIKLVHRYEFPSREFNYFQVVKWAKESGLSYYINESQMSIMLEDFLPGYKCEVTCKLLDNNRCYDNGTFEVYRLKGDLVLEMSIDGDVTKEDMYQRIQTMYHELDRDVQQHYPDPMDIGVRGDISLLRAVDSITFDSEYCRKAPPRVQPLVIRASEVDQELDKGKMVLIYCGNFYTTKDSDVSNGENYIGIINKFGEYDPSKRYNPVIRTYRKNHLLSKKFKELKAYLLRHSTDIHSGYISKDDILLPKRMTHLYSVKIFNPPLNVVDIHTKKTVITNTNKVATGEVPDYIKSLLGTRDVRRCVADRPGTGLLHCCDVDPEPFAEYVCSNLSLYPDTICVDVNSAKTDILSYNVDHRIYGKLLEMYTGKALIVFSSEGLVPYRVSKIESRTYYILYLASNNYDAVAAVPEHGKRLNLSTVRNMINSLQPVNVPKNVKHVPRNIDYTLTALKLVSYAARVLDELGYIVTYQIIPESECERFVENIYNSCCYYEGVVSGTGGKYIESLVTTRRSNVVILRTLGWLKHIYRNMIDITDNSIVIYSPVDMSKYHKWNHLLEDCLYYSSKCYRVSNTEEVQCIRDTK